MFRTMIMAYDQYYSDELKQKVERGMGLNADKCFSNGGLPPLGYKSVKINPGDEKSKKKFVIDEETAPIVREIFTKYANGVSIKEICESLNQRQLKTAKGVKFNKSSMNTMLSNRRYLGIYIYGETEIPGGIPQIIDEDLFKKVAERLKLNKAAPGRARAKAEYLLTTKLYCGYCKSMMIGHSSNQISKKGVIFNYYRCKNSGGKRPCKKKMIQKDYIEDIVINECHKLLTPQNIHRIAREVVKVAESYDDRSEIIRLQGLLKEAQSSKENQMASLRACKDDVIREMIFEDLGRIGAEIKELEKQIEIEERRRNMISEKDIIEFLTRLANNDTISDVVYRKSLVRVFVNKIFLYDDKFTITFNTGDDEVTISDVLLANIEEGLEAQHLCLSNEPGHQFRQGLEPNALQAPFFVGKSKLAGHMQGDTGSTCLRACNLPSAVLYCLMRGDFNARLADRFSSGGRGVCAHHTGSGQTDPPDPSSHNDVIFAARSKCSSSRLSAFFHPALYPADQNFMPDSLGRFHIFYVAASKRFPGDRRSKNRLSSKGVDRRTVHNLCRNGRARP